MNSLATSLQNAASHPDASYIRHKVPIAEIAIHLGLEVHGDFARCFRPENHKNGDADPSLHFHRNRARCFHCDSRDFSNLDLIMKVRGCDFPSAIQWVRYRFLVPDVKAGRPVGSKTERRPYRVGFNGELESLVRAGVFGQLSSPARDVLQVLVAFRDEHNRVDLSYRAFRRYAGLGSDTTIRKATEELTAKHIIKITTQRHTGPIKPHNVYHLTLDHPKLRAMMNATYESEAVEIERERTHRADIRNKRSHSARLLPGQLTATRRGVTNCPDAT